MTAAFVYLFLSHQSILLTERNAPDQHKHNRLLVHGYRTEINREHLGNTYIRRNMTGFYTRLVYYTFIPIAFKLNN